MKNADHLIANTRLLALILADKDEEKAEEYLEWAYGDFPGKARQRYSKEEYTAWFIETYLKPTKPGEIQKRDIRQFIWKYIIRRQDLDYEAIHDAIIRLDNSVFFVTAYWISISSYIKHEADLACERCGRRGDEVKLKTVRKSYEFHSYELLHLDNLACLCEECSKHPDDNA